MQLFNYEVLDIDIPKKNTSEDNFNLLKELVGKDFNINGLLLSLVGDYFLEILDLSLTKEQRIFVIYYYIDSYYVYDKLEEAVKLNKISLDELLTVISLFMNKFDDERHITSILWYFVLTYTNFKADKTFFTYFIKWHINNIYGDKIQRIIKAQLELNNKAIFYFCNEYYKRNDFYGFLFFPVNIKELKDYFLNKLENGWIDNNLGFICSAKIDNKLRIKLLKRFYHLLEKHENDKKKLENYFNLSSAFRDLKKVDDSEEAEAIFVDIWVKFKILGYNNYIFTYPNEDMITYKSNLAKLRALDLYNDLERE